MDPIVPGTTYGGSPGAWGGGFYGGNAGYSGGGYMGNYLYPRNPPPQQPPQQQYNFDQSPFQDNAVGDFLRRLRGLERFQPVNLFQPVASGINFAGTFGGGN